MYPRIGDILVYRFKNFSTASCDWRVTQAIFEKDVYILQNQVTGEIVQETSQSLDVYYHYLNGGPPR